MKRFFAFLVFLLLFCGGAWADVDINETNFPDATFRAYVKSRFDTVSDDVLSDSEIENITELDVSNMGISSLQGVEHFTALRRLLCHMNQLTTLDVSKNTALTYLSCRENQLTTLDVSNNAALTYLYCHDNQLTTLDLSGCTALFGMMCGYNQLTSLELSKNTNLADLDCQHNQLISLDVSKNTALRDLDCSYNQLMFLDLSNNTALAQLNCNNNQLATLDLSGKGFISMYCFSQKVYPLLTTSTNEGTYQLDFGNYMASSDFVNVSTVQGYTSSTTLTTTSYSNGIATFSENPVRVTYIYATGYATSYSTETLDVTISGSSSDVVINARNFPDATFRSYVKSNFDTNSDDILSAEEIASVTEIRVNNMGISSLRGVEHFTALTTLECYSNKLTELDVRGCTALTWLLCYDNQLTTIDVTKNTALTHLGCEHNQLTTLDLSNNTALSTLYCNGNHLTTLNLSKITALSQMWLGSQTVSPLYITTIANGTHPVSTSYPYYLYFSNYMSSNDQANISGDITAYDSDGNEIDWTGAALTDSGDRVAMFAAAPSSVKYNYATGYGTTTMDVTISGSIPYYDQADGNTEATAYPISSVSDMLLLQERLANGEEENGKFYKLTTSLDMSSIEPSSTWYGIGRDNNFDKGADQIVHPFTGHFDGQGYTITVGFNYAGVFGVLSADKDTIVVQNLKLVGDTHYSPLAFALMSGIVKNCSFIGTVKTTGIPDSAGLISFMFRGSIEDCTVSANISSTNGGASAGGIVAYMGAGTIKNCTIQASSVISASQYAGGIVGHSRGGTIENCTVEEGVTITATDTGYAGGVVGYDESNGTLSMNGNTVPGNYSGGADSDVAINSTNFPDEIFRLYVSNFDSNDNGSLSEAEIDDVIMIDVEELGISSLQGIEFFTALRQLRCASNDLETLDVTKNEKLVYLDCDSNRLTTLDVSKNEGLTGLACGNNQLGTLDVSKNTALTTLYCDLNNLATLDVSNNLSLDVLACGGNQLTTLDVTKNVALTSLTCYDNKLTGLDVSKNVSLDTLGCFSNDLGTLDVSNNTVLLTLWCWDNGLTALDVSKNLALEELSCFNNKLTVLDVSKNVSLDTLNCGSNKLVTLDVSNNELLIGLSCEDNHLTSLDVSHNIHLEGLACWSNDLTQLDVSKNVSLDHLDCNTNQLKVLDVSNNPYLGYLDCRKNHLAFLDLTSKDNLYAVFCYSQDVSPLNITAASSDTTYKLDFSGYMSSDKFEKISGDVLAYSSITSGTADITTSFDVLTGRATFASYPAKVKYNYFVTSYDVSGSVYVAMMDVEISGSPNVVEINETNFPDEVFRLYVSTELDKDEDGWLSELEIENATSIYVSNRSISSLKGIEHFTALTYLDCDYNQLTSLDVSKNTALITLYCRNNQLTELDVSNNKSLTGLACNNNLLTVLDLSENTLLTELGCAYNQLTTLNINNCSNLTSLYCAGNKLTTLDLSGNTALTSLNCDFNQLTALDVSSNNALTSLSCGVQSVSSPDITATGNSSYPYQLNFKQYMTSDQFGKIGAISANDSSGNPIGQTAVYLVSDGILMFAAYPAKIRYYYNTGYNSVEMDVTIDNSNGTPPGDIVLINSTNFPDEAFRKYLSDTYDSGGSGNLSESTLSSITTLNLGGKGISSLEGLGYFTNLTSLYCYGNNLTTLDVSGNGALTYLDCAENQLTELDVSNNTLLVHLDCSDNQLTELDVSRNTALGSLKCYNNKLTSLVLGDNDVFRTLDCHSNDLTALDVSKYTSLWYLDCAENQLTELDVSNNEVLGYLYCYSNKLRTLDVSNTVMEHLECISQDTSPLTITSTDNSSYPYQLTVSDYVSSDNVAKVLGVQGFASNDAEISTNYSNGIATFASYPLSVKYYYETGYSDVSMDVTISDTADSPGSVAVNSTNFPDDTFRAYVSNELDLNGDGSLSVSEIALATTIDLGGTTLSSLKGVEFFTALTYLNCYNSQLTELDVSANRNLQVLDCSRNQFTTLDVSNNTALTALYCANNNLTTLNVSNNTALERLAFDYNPISTIDLSNNRNLAHLDCFDSNLSTLDVSRNTALYHLSCHENHLRILNLSSNTALTELSCGSQDVSGFTVEGVADPEYPYLLNFSTYITAANLSNISGVQALDSNGANITTTYATGIARFTSRPTRVRYNYNTGNNNNLMTVTVTVGIVEYVPEHDTAILDLVSRGLLDENYRPRITFGGEGNDFSGDFVKGAVLTREVSLGFKAQTWNVYINGQSVKILSSSSFRRGGVRVVEVADGITIQVNEDGTGANIRVNTGELDNGNNNIQLGVVPEGGTEETALVDLGTVTVSNPPRQVVSEDTPVVVIEEATITPVVLSEDVIQRLADSVSVDRSEIIMLTSDDFDKTEAPEPTEEMHEVARRDNVSLVAKLNTVSVRQEGWYAFQVTVSDDLVGTSVNDLRIYAAEETDFIAGSLRASFAFLPLVNGVAGGFEIHNLLGIKLDTVPKQFLAVVFLSAGKSLTMYIGKILLMLLVGCSAAGGLGVVAVLGVFLIRRYRRRR